MRNAAWAVTNKQEAATQELPRFATRLYRLVMRNVWHASWDAGYSQAIAEVGAGRMRGHFTSAPRPKRRFDSADHAMAWAAEHGHSDGVKTYECSVCGCWHLATAHR